MRIFFLSFIETLLRALTLSRVFCRIGDDDEKRKVCRCFSFVPASSCLLSLTRTTSSHRPEQALPVDPELSSVP